MKDGSLSDHLPDRVRTDKMVRTGIGLARGHFGEFLQGYFEDISQVVRDDVDQTHDRASLTVPLQVNLGIFDNCSRSNCHQEFVQSAKTGSLAVFKPTDADDITIIPRDRDLAKKAVCKTLQFYGRPNQGGEIKLITNGNISRGFGTSTSDIIASVRATIDGIGEEIGSINIGKFAASVEGASDGIMYDRAVLFVTTRGVLLEDFGYRYPTIDVLGFDTSDDGEGMNTLELPPRKYNESDRKKLENLRKMSKKAIKESNVNLLGKVSTESAYLNQKFLEKPLLDEVLSISDAFGGAGIVVAHSGTLMGILFNPSQFSKSDIVENVLSSLESLGVKDVMHYRTGP